MAEHNVSSYRLIEQAKSDGRFIDFSGKDSKFVSNCVAHIIPIAERMVVMPDLGPTEKGLVPTGSVTEINTRKHPDWLKVVKGADIGCGMLLAKFDRTNSEDITGNQSKFDQLAKKLREEIRIKKAYLGGGNHFIDFVSWGDGSAGVVIHTGTPKTMQDNLSRFVGDEKSYMTEYEKVVSFADNNRIALLDVISGTYGKADTYFHMPHNTIYKVPDTDLVRIYKGAIHVQDHKQLLFLPSHMGGEMDLYYPGDSITENTLMAAPHGTGRIMSIGEFKEMSPDGLIVPDIMHETGGDLPFTELPGAYQDIRDVESIMLSKGLMNLEDPVEHIKPIGILARL